MVSSTCSMFMVGGSKSDLIKHHPVRINLCISFWVQHHSLVGSEVGKGDFCILRAHINCVYDSVVVKILFTDVSNSIPCNLCGKVSSDYKIAFD